MKYKKLWTDMHSNLHHEQIKDLPHWCEQMRKIMDFWPFAYYPFYMRKTSSGLGVEDIHEKELIEQDWEYIREFTKKVNAEGFPMFMGYEWQGSGKDGDHNVFFLDNEQSMAHPLRYEELVEYYKHIEAIGIPHHMAYSLGSRGKNWDTHNEAFSPFAEIYSSHGCSESDDGPFDMNRHIHMGPRTGETTFERAIDKGYKIGVIAAGDNHSVPGVFEHGTLCVLAEDNTKEAIWDAFKNRRTYALSQSRIELDFEINDAPMGSEIEVGDTAKLHIHVKGTDAVDRIEILQGNILEDMIIHSGTWERKPQAGNIRFKFRVEFGWGPDTRVYKDIFQKQWHGKLDCGDGKLLGIEKCWNNFGQELTNVTENSCEFDLTTYKSTASGKWMGPSNVTTEGFIFEVEADANGSLQLEVDGKNYTLSVQELLNNSKVYALWDEINQLTKETWGDITHYRDDPWWHNAYKFKVHRFAVEDSYEVTYDKELQVEEDTCYRLRVYQKNGDCAWSSPIYLKKK